MINLSLPGFFAKFKFIPDLLEFYYQHPDFFYQDRRIDSFYDADNSLLWRGGRDPRPEQIYDMNEILDFFNKYPSIQLRHVFTNCLINENLVNDYLCNHFVKNCIRPQDKVILNHPLLIKHFKQNYPQIPIIYSTTMGIIDSQQINDITKHNLYVVNYNYNNNDIYLANLAHPENIELICAEPCYPLCQYRKQHYLGISQTILLQQLSHGGITECPFGHEQLTFSELMTLPHAISNERLVQLSQKGFNNFKISGRSLMVPNWLETILYYIALPEKRDYIRQKLLTEWW